MNFTERLLGRPSTEETSTRDLLALARFSFESDDHSVLSTDRLFRRWDQGEETQYNAGQQNMEEGTKKDEDLIVCSAPLGCTATDGAERSPGMDRTIRATL